MRVKKIFILLFFIPSLFQLCKNNTENRIPTLPVNLESNVEVAKQIAYVKDVIKENPDNAMVNYRLAKLYLSIDDVENAYIASKKAVFLENDNIQYGLLLIKCYVQKGLYVDAYELLERLKSKISNQEYLKYALVIFIQTGKYVEANVMIDKQIATYPNDIYYIIKKAEITYALKDTSKTIEMYEKALRFDTNSTIILVELAKLYNYKKEYKKSQILAKKAIKTDTNNVDANYYNAIAFKNFGFKDSALFYYDKILSKDSMYTTALYNSAIIHIQKYNYPKSESYLKRLFKQNQNLPNINFKLAFVLQKQLKFDESLIYYLKIDTLDMNYNFAQKAIIQIKYAQHNSLN